MFDEAIIKEDSRRTGFWVEQAKKLAEISTSQFNMLVKETLAFLLPRFYRMEVLDFYFSNIKEITNGVCYKSSFGEHHHIFEQAKKLSKKYLVNE